MSLISTKSRYGLRLLLDLAERRAEGPVDLASVAKRQDIPEAYLAKLAQALKGAGFLRAARGSRGGYELARRPEDLSLLDLVEALEGKPALLECAERPEACGRAVDCRAWPVWKGLDAVIREYLAGVSLAAALGQAEADYVI